MSTTIALRALNNESDVTVVTEAKGYKFAAPRSILGTPSFAMSAAGQSAVVTMKINSEIEKTFPVIGTVLVPITNVSGEPLTSSERNDVVFEISRISDGGSLLTTDEPNGSPANPFPTPTDVYAAYPLGAEYSVEVRVGTPLSNYGLRYVGAYPMVGEAAANWVKADAYSANRWVWDGDSVTAGQGGVQTMTAFTSGRMIVAGSVAVAGQNSTQILARISTTLSLNANIWLIMGTNDAEQSVPLSTFASNLSSYILRVKNAKKSLIVGLIPPNNTQPLNAQKINIAIREICRKEGVPVCDPWETMRAADGTWLPGKSSDGTHPYGYVLQDAAASASTQLSSFLADLPQFIPSLAQPDGGIRTNNLFLLDANANGLADGINITGSATWSLADAALPKIGKTQTLQVSNYAGDVFFDINGGTVAVGDKILAICRLAFDPQGGTNTKIEVKFSGNSGANTHGNYFGGSGVEIRSAVEGVVAREFTIAAGTGFDAQLGVRRVSGGVSLGEAKLTQWQYYNLTALGLA